MPYKHIEYECDYCHKQLPWYCFPSGVDELTKNFELLPCNKCIQDGRNKPKKHELFFVERRIHNLIKNAMNNSKMSDLRSKLFETLDKVLNKEITPQAAKSVCEISQTIINSVKVEVDYLRVIGVKKPSSFMQLTDAEES